MNLTQDWYFLELGEHSDVHTILFANEHSYTYQSHSVCHLQKREEERLHSVKVNRNRARCMLGKWLRPQKPDLYSRWIFSF